MENGQKGDIEISLVFIINSFYPGGAERILVDDVNELVKKGVKIGLITLRKEKAGASIAGDCRFNPDFRLKLHFRGFFDFFSWLKLVKTLRRWKPRAAVTHLWFANSVGRIAALAAGVPRIVSFEHNVYDAVKSRRQFLLDRILARFTDKIIAVSGAVRESLLRRGIPAEKITVILNGVSLERFGNIPAKEEARRALGIPEKEFVYLFIGRLTRQKGVDVLLRAFAGVSGASLVIAGDGEERASLEKIAEDLGIGGKVNFLGIRNDVSLLFAAADCFVLPSRWEGLSVVLIEAMAAGMPVIASAVDGAKEIVRDGDNGVLVEAEDAESFKRAMLHLKENSFFRKKIAEKAKEDARKFSGGEHADKLLSVVL